MAGVLLVVAVSNLTEKIVVIDDPMTRELLHLRQQPVL
jgi:hypothetical protein